MSRKSKRASSLLLSSSSVSSSSPPTSEAQLRPLPPSLDGAPRLDVQVYHVPGGAIARATHPPQTPQTPQQRHPAVQPPSTQPQPTTTPTQLLDALVRGVWSVAISFGEARGWYEERWRRSDFRPEDLLDVLIRLEQEDAFPFPSSPRFDGVGGAGAPIAADGSPGVPIAWVRYMARTEDGKPSEALDVTGRRIVAQAQGWLAREHPEAWAIYRDHVIGRVSLGEIARQSTPKLSYRQAQRRCARARALLLAQIAFATGEATREEYASVLATATAATENAAVAVS